jgi:phosphoketolase
MTPRATGQHMDAAAAVDFVREHGVVLVSAKGEAPTLTHAIAGEPIKGSWWGHPLGKRIFALQQHVCDHPDILVCRLLDDKLTLVHRRLWPALAAAAPRIAPSRLCRVTQEHTASGRHVNCETPFPDWLPADAAREAAALAPAEALAALGAAFFTNSNAPDARD